MRALGLLDAGDHPLADAASEGVAGVMILRDPAGGADWWLENGRAELREKIYSEIVRQWALSDPGACGRWLRQRGETEPLDLARASFARALTETDRDAARGWVRQIADDSLRDALNKELRLEH